MNPVLNHQTHQLESESRAAYEGLLEGVEILGFDWQYRYLSASAETYNRRPNEELLGKRYMDAWPGIEQTKVFQAMKRCMEERVPERIEYKRIYADGTSGWFILSIQPIPDGVRLLSFDITDLKEAERRLAQMKRLNATLSQVNQLIVRVRERDELYRSICDVAVRYGEFALAWVGLLDMETGAVHPVAATGLDLTHWPFEEVNLNHGPFKDGISARAIRASAVVTSEDIQTDERMQRLHDLIITYPYHSTASIPILLRKNVIGVLNLVSGDEGLFKSEEEVHLLEEMSIDISFALDTMENEAERTRAEERSEQSRRTLSLFVDFAPAAIAMFDCSMCYIAASRRYLLDYHLGDMNVIGRSHYEIFPDVPERWKEIHRRCLAGFVEKAERDPFPRADGGLEWVQWEIHPWYDKPGKIGGIILFSEVITEYVNAEEAVIESASKLETALESMTDAVFISDAEGRFVQFNEAFAIFHKFKNKDECAKTFAEYPAFLEVYLPNGELAPIEQWAVPRALRGETARNAEYMLRRKDTGETWMGSYSFAPIRDKHGAIIGSVVAGRDITEMKMLQSQLLQAQKLESLGTLASGIAHDFNNILSIILGHASLLAEAPYDHAQFPKRVQAILKASTRGADLVKQLLTFARKTDVRVRPLFLNEIVEEIVRLLHETFPKTIAVDVRLDERLPAIEADATHVHQVLLNLCVNARDAMPAGGTLAIRTHRESGDTVRFTHPDAAGREYVVLSIADTGTGMDREMQRRIFEPFFTTKERDKGTGLGLSMVFGIMQSHHGFIDLQSEIGKGSTFSCFFPVQ